MKMYLIYGLISIVTLLIFIIIKDKLKALRLTGILTIFSSLLLLILSSIIKIIIDVSINTINTSIITNYLFTKVSKISIILSITGLIEIFISQYFYTRKIS